MTSVQPGHWLDRRRLDLACGLSLLTRLPSIWLAPPADRDSTQPWPLARSIWCWPVIATLIGALTGSVLAALRMAHVPPLAAAGLALACQSILTGGLHEDGLADMADGCGGSTPERRLAIMRDSHVGSYGVMALGLSLLVRAAALAALPIWASIGVCATTACLARMAMLLVPALVPPARANGLARMLSPLPFPSLWGAVFVAVGVMACLSILAYGHAGLSLWAFLALMAAPAGIGCATAALVALCARRLLGGFTGDVLGCCAVVAECLLLSFYAALA
ncbi:adenosylcobinamide-GDP ribazoletransferase [Acetobacter fabarum]|uniref:adenosylcobinamide-GDP ribazoletransferase n=1 Tax=Acetobacter fabarum TaxID=483199 RepID=UPI00209D2835|nr:adenosylcobinamide-GDP ribazoletransferase [Acetobacter fabarum]MCP1228058.1 adenosylcobinamide-GDP ribazoletransferase [Acetobacter fabarum]MCP1233554.1 adenosylcobinamide-GDP ribazoletransferase [Acetobacter fabarum]